MISDQKLPISLNGSIKSFDISNVTFDDHGIIDFYWPLDNRKSAELLKNLTHDLIPYVTKNEKKWSIYNVDDSLGTHLEILDSNENTLGSYIFGPSSSDYSRCYVRKKDSAEVFLVNKNVMYNLQANDQYWGEVIEESVPLLNQEL